jgi:uncharacterized protein (DUF2267 family)
MSMTGLDTFDTTVQKSNVWLKELMEEEGWQWQDRHRAYLSLRAVLHTLRDRLSVNEAAHLGAQLPMLIRGLYYEGWDPSNVPAQYRSRDEFLSSIRQSFQRVDENVDCEQILRSVLTTLARRVSEGEIQDIKSTLPKDILDLWPETIH